MNGDNHNETHLIYCSIDTLFQYILSKQVELGPGNNRSSYVAYQKEMKARQSIVSNEIGKVNSFWDMRKLKKRTHTNSVNGKSENQEMTDLRSCRPFQEMDGESKGQGKALSLDLMKEESDIPNFNNKVKGNDSNNNKPGQDKYKFTYFFGVRLTLVLGGIIANSYFFIILLCLSQPKNNTYCFDKVNTEFVLCSETESSKCGEGINENIYNNEIYHEDPLQELILVNAKYLAFYHRELALFLFNNNQYDPSRKIVSLYNVRIHLTKNEQYLIKNMFCLPCSKKSIDLLAVMIIGLIAGNIILGLLADLFGRRPLLIISLLIQAFGGFLMVIGTYVILSKGSVGSQKSTTQMFAFDYHDYPTIDQFISNTNYKNINGLEQTNLYSNYLNSFNTIKSEVLKAAYIKGAYRNYSIIFLLGLFTVGFGNSATYNIIKAYLLEYSLCEDFFFSDYFQIHLTEPSALFITYVITIFTNSFHVTLIIINSLSIIMAVIVYLVLYESLRFLYEYSRYDLITENVRRLLDNHTALFNPKNIESNPIFVNLQYENKEEYEAMVNNSEATSLDSFIYMNGVNKNFMTSFRRSQNRIIDQRYFLAYPFTIITLYKCNRTYHIDTILIYVLVFIVGIIHFLSMSKVSSYLMLTRDVLHNNYFLNMKPIYIAPFYAFSLYLFSQVLKLLSMHWVLLISFCGTIIFSLFYELVALFPSQIIDLNKHNYFSSELLIQRNEVFLTTLFFFQMFFVLSIKFATFYYITKLTKTIYRCTFTAICNCILYITVLLVNWIEVEFTKNLFYVALFCMLGIFNLNFLSNASGSGIITDIHELSKKTKSKTK